MSKHTQKINTLDQLAASLKSEKQLQRISPEKTIKRLSNEQYKSEARYFTESIKQTVESEKEGATKEAISWAKEEKEVNLGAFARGLKEAMPAKEQGKTKENLHEM